jgi:tRNA_anti-like
MVERMSRPLWQPLLVALTVAGLTWCASCADRLPEQDLRILQAVPVAKMPVDDLWKEYAANAAEADRKYKGHAVEIAGKVTSAGRDTAGRQYLFFVEADPLGVRAQLLDDQAVAIVADAQPGVRVTLRCFAEGLAGDLALKSCVRP